MPQIKLRIFFYTCTIMQSIASCTFVYLDECNGNHTLFVFIYKSSFFFVKQVLQHKRPTISLSLYMIIQTSNRRGQT